MLVTQTTKNAFFFEKFYRGHDPPHPRRCLYTPPVETPAPQRTRTDCTAQAAEQIMPDARQTTQGKTHTPGRGHAAPVCTRYQTGHAGRSGRRRRWRAGSVSETVQIWTHSNMNDFQHKNVCKTIDTNTRMCYYIDNTRTCYTTTKTGGQKP